MSGSRGGRGHSDQQNLLLLENVLTSSPLFAGHLVQGKPGRIVLSGTAGRERGAGGAQPAAPGPQSGQLAAVSSTGWLQGKRGAGDVPLAHRPAKSLHPALNLMTQIRALKVFATDRIRSFINNDLHIDA